MREELNVPFRGVAVDGQARLAEVGDDVDASIVEKLHAGRMVRGRVNGVGADDVGAEIGQERDITLAVGLAAERVDKGRIGGRGAGGGRVLLVSDALEEELCPVRVEELGALEVTLVSSRLRWACDEHGAVCLHLD